MQIDKDGLLVLVAAIVVAALVFTGLTGALPGGTVPSREGSEKAVDPESKDKVGRLAEQAEELARGVEERFGSEEWQARLQEIEEHARELDRRFNGPEFQERIRPIEEAGARIGERFQGEQWRQFENRLQNLGEEISHYFHSAEWEEAMAHIQERTQALNHEIHEQLLDSAEWKAQQAKIEGLTNSIHDLFDEDFQLRMQGFRRQLKESLKDLPKQEQKPTKDEDTSEKL